MQHYPTLQDEELSAFEVATFLFEGAKNKAASRGLEFTIKLNDVLKRVECGHCEMTNIPFDFRRKKGRSPNDYPFRASLDRIDNRKGYHPDNIQVVVKIYNTAKWTWRDDDVYKMALGVLVVRGIDSRPLDTETDDDYFSSEKATQDARFRARRHVRA